MQINKTTATINSAIAKQCGRFSYNQGHYEWKLCFLAGKTSEARLDLSQSERPEGRDAPKEARQFEGQQFKPEARIRQFCFAKLPGGRDGPREGVRVNKALKLRTGRISSFFSYKTKHEK